MELIPLPDTESELVQALCKVNKVSFIKEKLILLARYTISNNLLLFYRKLVIERRTKLSIKLIREVYNQVLSAYSSTYKIY